MAFSVSSSTSTGKVMNNWMDFYVKHRNDNGPIQNLFGQNLETMGRITLGHLNDTNALTETIVGTSYGNMMMFPGKSGTMQIAHQGFGASTEFVSTSTVPKEILMTVPSSSPSQGSM
jgi:hypothetical protein